MIEHAGPSFLDAFLAVMIGVAGVPLIHLVARISKAWTERREFPLHIRLHALPFWKNLWIWRDIKRKGP